MFIKSNFQKEEQFYRTLINIGLPIAFQYFLTNTTVFLNLMMVGKLGETSIAAVGLANQVYFLLDLILFGTCSGATVLSAQYWGVHDVHGIRKVLVTCLVLCFTATFSFGFMAVMFPNAVLQLYTQDAVVVGLGVDFLEIMGWSYLALAINFSFGFCLRSIETAKLPMLVNGFALGLDLLLNYTLIFGHFGFPALGVKGAAIGTCIAKWVECVVLLFFVYRLDTPIKINLTDILSLNRIFITKYLHISLPVILNEVAWALGMTSYRFVYARISTEAIAAINICTTIEEVAFVPLFGIAFGGAVMLGNRIGAGEKATALQYARRLLVIGFCIALLIGALVFFSTRPLLSLYNLNTDTSHYLALILNIFGMALWLRVSNLILLVSILRGGGDTRYGLFVELGTVWLVGVPLAFIGAFAWHLTVEQVYLLVLVEEVVKLGFAFTRFLSGKWVHDLVRQE